MESPKKVTLKGLKHFYKGKYINVSAAYSDKSNCWEFIVRDVSDVRKENYETVEEIALRFV